MKKIVFSLVVTLISLSYGYSQQVITVPVGTAGTFTDAGNVGTAVNKQFNISTGTNVCINLTFSSGSGSGSGYPIPYHGKFVFYNCDANFVYSAATKISETTDYNAPHIVVNSTVANGKMVVVFTYDGCCGNYSFTGSYIPTAATAANIFSTSGPVNLEAYSSAAPNLTISDYTLKNMGSISSTTTDYTKSMILMKSGTYQLGLGANKISSNGNLGISASYLYQTANSFYFSIPSLSNILTINSSGITAGASVYLKREHLVFSNSSGHACIYFGNAGAGDLWIRRTSTAGNPNLYADLVIIKNNGNVGIGTTDPGAYKLNVAGSIRANEVKINTTGADFVFAPTYKLRPLSEVESFIKLHQHLPEIATAKDMEANGVDVSEMQTKLLQKIEELTLYTIELEKKATEKEEKLNKLESEMAVIKEMLLKNNLNSK